MENGSFARCARHPSQFVTGFCSSCLVERLSSVDTVQRNPEPSTSPRRQQVDLSNSAPFPQSQPSGGRVRKTLLSLFQLDDADFISTEKDEKSTRELLPMSDSNGGDPESGVLRHCNGSQVMQASLSSDCGARFHENIVRLDAAASSTSCALDDSNTEVCPVKKIEPIEDEFCDQKGASHWLGSVFSRKLKLGRSYSRKNSSHKRSTSGGGGFGEKGPIARTSSRHSYDLKVPCDSNKSVWEDPRHSWDGSMMSRAFTCSFALGEKREDRNLDYLVDTDVHSRRQKNGLCKEATLMDLKTFSEATDTSKINEEGLSEEVPSSSDNRLRKSLKDRFHEDQHQNISVPNFRRKSHRWSKVWNWSITSPCRECVQNHEQVLERSLSESWQDCNGVKNMGTIDSDRVLHIHGNDMSYARQNFTAHRSKYPLNGDPGGSRSEWQKKRREYTFGRSRSVHYSSPGNLDSGLLRFYLTPLRSSRRFTNRGRMKTTKSFAKGILGFY